MDFNSFFQIALYRERGRDEPF